MLDTQDAQVMPVICKKHFWGAPRVEACGGFDEEPGSWLLGSPPAWGATSCTDAGTPAAGHAEEFPALWFPTWLL